MLTLSGNLPLLSEEGRVRVEDEEVDVLLVRAPSGSVDGLVDPCVLALSWMLSCGEDCMDISIPPVGFALTASPPHPLPSTANRPIVPTCPVLSSCWCPTHSRFP